MAEGIKEIFQFKITLRYSAPKIWRKIQVPSSFTFKELHFAIQMAMGWRKSHLHQFEMNGMTISTPFDGGHYNDVCIVDEAETCIKDYFKAVRQKADYEYDFGVSWRHTVELEKIMQAKPGEKYPKCTDGRRACPPEDCGGPAGYENLLYVIQNPQCENHDSIMEWLKDGGYTPYDPAKFSYPTVFDNWGEEYMNC